MARPTAHKGRSFRRVTADRSRCRSLASDNHRVGTTMQSCALSNPASRSVAASPCAWTTSMRTTNGRRRSEPRFSIPRPRIASGNASTPPLILPGTVGGSRSQWLTSTQPSGEPHRRADDFLAKQQSAAKCQPWWRPTMSSTGSTAASPIWPMSQRSTPPCRSPSPRSSPTTTSPMSWSSSTKTTGTSPSPTTAPSPSLVESLAVGPGRLAVSEDPLEGPCVAVVLAHGCDAAVAQFEEMDLAVVHALVVEGHVDVRDGGEEAVTLEDVDNAQPD